MQITLKSDIRQITKNLNGFKDQIPFATARALTNLAIGARKSTVKRIERDINKPTPFTRKSPRYKRATKASQTAQITIVPAAYAYLAHVIDGGQVRPKSAKIAIGVNARRNQYGNTARKGINTVLARADTFTATIKGIHGIWQRYGGKKKGRLKLLYAFHPVTQYQADQFKYFANVKQYVAANFFVEFDKSLKQAIRSAKL